MSLTETFGFLVFLAFILGILVLLFIYITSKAPDLFRYDTEKSYQDPKAGNKRCVFPHLEDEATVDLSVIVPAYNEEERLPVMMNETMEYFEQRQRDQPKFTYEIIVVDDGSKDKTTETALCYAEQYGVDRVRVMTLAKNRGKGGAVRRGMLAARGRRLLFADADGATQFSDITKLEVELRDMDTSNSEGMAVVCGSRAHLEKESIAERSLFRTFLMLGFHFLVWFLCVRNVKDTQCGFKLFTRPAARLLFNIMHVDRWAFDVDILHIAQHYSIPVREVAVNWQEIEGSKLSPLLASLQMFRDLVLIRLRYMIGAWSMKLPQKQQ